MIGRALARAAAALGVDYVQWRALTRTMLRADFAVLRGAQGRTRAARGGASLIATAIISTLLGVVPALVIWANPDPLTGAIALATLVAITTTLVVMSGEGATIVSPGDHAIVGFRPVSSRTYFAVRATNVAIYTGGQAVLVCYVPILACYLRGGLRAAAGGGLVAGLTTAAVTSAWIGVYGTLLRTFGGVRVLRAISILQTVTLFFATMGMMAGSQLLINGGAAARVRVSSMRGIWLYPGAWFASWLPIAAGAGSAATWLGAAGSLAAAAACAYGLRGRFSLEYTAELADLQSRAGAPSAGRGWAIPSFLTGEARAIALLARCQLRDDPQFRMAVFSVLPSTLGLMAIGFYVSPHAGSSPDPFLGTDLASSNPAIMMGLFMLPSSLRQALVTTSAYRASWIFFTTPADRARLAIAGPAVVSGLFVAPLIAVIGAVFMWWFGNAVHGAVHAAFLGLLCYTGVQIDLLVSPNLPFSRAPSKAAGNRQLAALVVPVMGAIVYAIAVRVMYRSTARVAWLFLVVGALAWTLTRLARVRTRKAAATFEYES